ncbi:MAG: hypothetical protein RLZZ136_449 [Pseudomonadota bacterium]|jgi:uncharacterized protein (TIGR02001 family)
MFPPLRCLLVVSALLLATPALADETDVPGDLTLSGSAAVVSQYRWRGLAQSDNQPAVQAAITLNHVTGFYASLWGSSAKTGTGPIAIGGSEIDLAGGYAKEIGFSGLVIDGGVQGYIYPDAAKANWLEFYAALVKSLGPVQAKVGLAYAPAQKAFDLAWTSPRRSNTYIYGDLTSGVPGTPLTLHGHVGHTAGGFAFGRAYLDYSLGVTVQWRKLAVDAALVGTDLSRGDISRGFLPRYLNYQGCGAAAACAAGFHRMAKPVGVVSVTARF